ncbi:hypothetical protein CDV55_103525 [Aspergillus turcosus]|uniref:Exosome complex protein n=1 Tax=Aspergillus turcosus TaxID=1245748 RepID=A0A229XP77_9EURO|nr:hypothetical protein CDV55_103525 [Aspergillus turcosus]RLM01740.1 hypothetical protein CFD26_103854 [Aspergillus turcosus]
MEAADLLPLLEQLDDNVDDLEEALKPILESPVSETSNKLPLLDKAKFHVLVTYALESLIFSYLRLHGVNAKEHPVFRELTRIKQYFGKIQALEAEQAEPEQRTMTLDKEAAGRFIKHGLAGNDKLDMQRKEQEAKQKARAQLKAALLAKNAAASETSSKNRTSSSDSESEPVNEDWDSEEAMRVASGLVTTPSETPQPENFQEGKKKKKDKGKHETSKASKKKKKRSKEEQQERKKERRQKKMEVRKAAKAK